MDLGAPVELRRLEVDLPDGDDMFGEHFDEHVYEDVAYEEEHTSQQVSDGKVKLNREHLPPPDVLVADPGRSGLPKAFRRYVYRLQPRTIVLIGNGRSLLRDCVLLSRRGYEVRTLAPF